MAARTYSQINNTVLRSRKMRGLDHKARWAWLSAHLRADYLGPAEYPVSLWAMDAQIDEAELQVAIGQLSSVGLIDWFPNLDIVRVTGFIKQRPPNNASNASGLCMDLTDLLYAAEPELEAVLLAVSAEFAVASASASLRWKTDRVKLREDMGEFPRGTTNDFGDRFLDCLLKELESASRPTRNELEALLPVLSLRRQNTVSTPSLHPADTQDVDETRRIPDEHKNKNEDLDGAGSDFGAIDERCPNTPGIAVAENVGNRPGPLPETLAAARRIGSIR